ncbi:hypothetical protein B0H13DRAFT_1866243 [Mycena leptocephala]|nr:hypothetical protein B0H13DRAFT_1866243 [Mycena leptocephala]
MSRHLPPCGLARQTLAGNPAEVCMVIEQCTHNQPPTWNTASGLELNPEPTFTTSIPLEWKTLQWKLVHHQKKNVAADNAVFIAELQHLMWLTGFYYTRPVHCKKLSAEVIRILRVILARTTECCSRMQFLSQNSSPSYGWLDSITLDPCTARNSVQKAAEYSGLFWWRQLTEVFRLIS